MIDALLKFTDQATAAADAVIQNHMDALHTLWRADYVIPGVQVWRASQDVGSVHTFLTGWFVLVSIPTLTPAAIALRDHAALQVAIDSEKARLRQAGMVILSNVSGVILQDIRMAPIFAGRDYPFGALT